MAKRNASSKKTIVSASASASASSSVRARARARARARPSRETTTDNKQLLKPKSTTELKKKKKKKKKKERASSKPKAKSKAKKEDPNKPKKPPTAFFYFLEDFRKGYQEQNPDVKSMRDVGKACGEKWKIMTYEEKVKYYDIATEKRAEFDKAIAEYERRKETGEDQDSYEDSEFDEY